MNEELSALINEWLEYDKNPNSLGFVKCLLENGNHDELQSIFTPRITFGTSGLRGRMGPGFKQINDLIIIQTTQGVYKKLKDCFHNPLYNGVIIGFDGRYNSKKWAMIAANIFARNKIKVYLPEVEISTPYLAYGVKYYNAGCGIMITASHNPKSDNGYKLYWFNGCQITSPLDEEISAAIQESLVPQENAWNYDDIYKSEYRVDPLPDLEDSYLKLQHELLSNTQATNPDFDVKITYTAMHGVGTPAVQKIVEKFGFKPLYNVVQQCEIDKDFPTVKFPNPEEGKCALNLAMEYADSIESPIILANDPDADRLAVAEKSDSEGWTIFNGNQLGALFGWWLFMNWKKKNPDKDPSNIYMISTVVSSRILQTMARKEGFQFVDTLTGFKWIGNKCSEIMSCNPNGQILLGFEEAIGFMCGTNVLDKDGVGALAVMMELIAHVYAKGMTLADQLNNVYNEYGWHLTNNGYYLSNDTRKTNAMFEKLRHWSVKDCCKPVKDGAIVYPLRLEDYPISNICDLTEAYDDNYVDNTPRLPTSKSNHFISFLFDNGVKLTLRTSGTEPKIKYYSELVASLKDNMTLDELKELLDAVIESMIKEFYRPEEHGFTHPIKSS